MITYRPASKRFIDLTGKTFGRWVVVSLAGKRGNHLVWLCKCRCGRTGIIYGDNLAHGLSRSCGCLNSDITAERNRATVKHGMCGSPEYEAWHAMIQRCRNPKSKAYSLYGGRGISVCKRWLSFEAFFDDMGCRPGAGHSIDRIDNSGNYTPGNCRWATHKQQDRNKRTNRLLTHGGITLCITEWSERLGINKHTIFTRLRKGWTVDRILAQPVK
jgi:hypothetical protein